MSIKSMFKEHISNSPISEHFKNNGIIFGDNNRSDFNVDRFETTEIREFTVNDMDATVDYIKMFFRLSLGMMIGYLMIR